MGSAIAWVDGQSALACVIDMSQEVPAEWEYVQSHLQATSALQERFQSLGYNQGLL